MKKPFIEISAENVWIQPIDAKPIEGYQASVNEETGKQLPYCCPYHKKVYDDTIEWFERFPNCCDEHRKIIKKWGNIKPTYNGIEDKVVKQLSYSEHFIGKRLINKDWYEDITDYIEYNVWSFGQPAIGLAFYLKSLRYYLQETKSVIASSQRKKLIEFIDSYYVDPGDQPKTDFNILYSTYQKWLKLFPFDIAYFAQLKPRFEKQIPLLYGKPQINKYIGIAKYKVHTQSSLLEALYNLTVVLLDNVKVEELRKQGKLTDLELRQLEFVDAELKTKSAEITKQFSKGELRYVKALKNWLSIHKVYFKEVDSLLKALPHQYKKDSPFSALEWATIFYYADETKLLPEDQFLKNRMEQFIEKHNISTTLKTLKSRYYQAKERINKKIDYPINRLERIVPFLKENYKQTVIKVENDISFLEENLSDY